MKRWVHVGITAAMVLFVFVITAFSQTDRETPVKKDSQAQAQTQAQSAVDKERYVIGPEDVLYIHVWKEDALSKTIPVRMDGKISLPLIHEIRAAGLTPSQLETDITEKLKAFYENPNVSVTVMETNSFKVYVSGEVKTPGVYKLREEATLLQIIPMAGGFTEWAKQRKILIIRKEDGKEKRITVDYKKILKGDDPGSNIVLKSGDTIIVP